MDISYVPEFIRVSLGADVYRFHRNLTPAGAWCNSESVSVYERDPEFLKRLAEACGKEIPNRIMDTDTVTFYTVPDPADDDCFYLVGPVCRSEDFRGDVVEDSLDKYAQAHGLRTDEVQLAYALGRDIAEVLLLLCNCGREPGRWVTLADLLRGNERIGEVTEEHHVMTSQAFFEQQENYRIHNSYDQERREMRAIREGNMEMIQASIEEALRGEFGHLSDDPLRNIRDVAIVGVSLDARAAIEGGVLPEIGFTMADALIRQIEKTTTILEIHMIAVNAKTQFTQAVADAKESRSGGRANRVVEEAKRAIFARMHDRISCEEIAGMLHVSKEYLSKIFKQSEGVSMSEYIMTAKCRLAENLLIYSPYSINEIAYYLGFCSQSHFGRNFKKYMGMTPSQYRGLYSSERFRTAD